jgi:hypothetical protein
MGNERRRERRPDRLPVAYPAVRGQGCGLQAIAKGFSILHGKNDHRKIEMETPTYDALYAWCREKGKV